MEITEAKVHYIIPDDKERLEKKPEKPEKIYSKGGKSIYAEAETSDSED